MLIMMRMPPACISNTAMHRKFRQSQSADCRIYSLIATANQAMRSQLWSRGREGYDSEPFSPLAKIPRRPILTGIGLETTKLPTIVVE